MIELRCRPFLMGAGAKQLCQQCFANFYSCQKVLTNRYDEVRQQCTLGGGVRRIHGIGM
jgi:hypothetical protein